MKTLMTLRLGRFWSCARQRIIKNKIEFLFQADLSTFAFEYVIFTLNLYIVLKLKRKLFFKNSVKIGCKIICLGVI